VGAAYGEKLYFARGIPTIIYEYIRIMFFVYVPEIQQLRTSSSHGAKLPTGSGSIRPGMDRAPAN